LDDADLFLNSLPFRPPPPPAPPLPPAPPGPKHPLPDFDPPTESLPPDLAEIRTRINIPYDTDAFDSLLDKHDLRSAHPDLTEKMRSGFRMGDFPELRETVIFKNHASVDKHREFVEAYLDGEVAAGRMSGPFTEEETRQIVGGHFQCSPMIVAEQTQELGKPNKLRLCRHLSKGDAAHPSTNDFIDKEDFPTKFGTAAQVAEIVSKLLRYVCIH
jgi:hypothetical protein